MTIINNNLMAQDTARQLQGHYGRLSTSIQRLSSGLRINSAADDAAGLAIRELMRSDISALQQGARNANDAISMIQVADGALAVIDEKLIRMKELAEQAATGTYNSTQRLMIESEYQAMAAEIDRIANATDFNGIKLLDGSLSGRHNGKGLRSTGAMKIHFGTANDSAEDYYYIAIGDCRAAALGVGNTSTYMEPVKSYVRVETIVEEPVRYNTQTSFAQYVDPVSGATYYKAGEVFTTDTNNPVQHALDPEQDREVIERLRMVQQTRTNVINYRTYVDPQTSIEYYSRDSGRTFITDPNQPASQPLNPNYAPDKAILDRLREEPNKSLSIRTTWDVYVNPDGREYYSCDGGRTFVPDVANPGANILDTANPAHKPITDAFTAVQRVYTVGAIFGDVKYGVYSSSDNRTYYSSDGGKTFVSNTGRPDETRLDPVADKAILDDMEPIYERADTAVSYDIYIDRVTNMRYYTNDRGKTFISNTSSPDNIVYRADDPNDAAGIANLDPLILTRVGSIACATYEDRANGNVRYYSVNGGITYFSDLADPDGSTLDRTDPGYAQLVANFSQLSSTTLINRTFSSYRNLVDNTSVWTCDGGQTFVSSPDNPADVRLDAANAADKAIIDRLSPNCQQSNGLTYFHIYVDPVDNQQYYTRVGGDGSEFFSSLIRYPDRPALVAGDPAQKAVIDRLQRKQSTVTANIRLERPDSYLIYKDRVSDRYYYSWDEGKTITSSVLDPYNVRNQLDPGKASDRQILDRLTQVTEKKTKVEYVEQVTGGMGAGAGYAISTQEAAQKSLEAIDRAIVSKDKIRAHLGAMQNRLENTITNLTIQAENLQAAESRISDADIALEMTEFVRNQILSQAATAMLGQANSFPHMMMSLIG